MKNIIYVNKENEQQVRTIVEYLGAECDVIERSWLVDPGTVICVKGEFMCGS